MQGDERRVEEVVEEVFIGVESDLRLGIDKPMPEPVFFTGRIIPPNDPRIACGQDDEDRRRLIGEILGSLLWRWSNG